MPVENPKKRQDVDKLRRILDNPDDPSLQHTLTAEDASLDSVRRRLTRTQTATARIRTTASMQPRLTIRQPPPTAPTTEELPLWTPLETPTATTQAPLPPPIKPSFNFSDQELFEVEPVEPSTSFEIVTDTEPQPHPTAAPEHAKDTTPTSELLHWEIVTPETTSKPASVPLQEFTEVTAEGAAPPLAEPEPFSPTKQTWRQRRAQKKTARIQAREAKRRETLSRTKTTPAPVQELPLPPPEEPPEQPKPLPTQNGEAFRGIPSIDDHIAELLFRNGYYTLEQLRQTPVGTLVKIKGIRRKQAKRMKKEVDAYFTASTRPTPPPPAPHSKRRAKKTPLKNQDADVTEWESYEASDDLHIPLICTYEGYTLYQREVKVGRRKTTMHFFCKTPPTGGTPASLPEGYVIDVNKRTGVPYIKKRK